MEGRSTAYFKVRARCFHGEKKVTKILYQRNQPTVDSLFADTTKIIKKVCWPHTYKFERKCSATLLFGGACNQFFASMIWFRSDFVKSSAVVTPLETVTAE